MEGDSTVSLLFWSKTVGQPLQYVDAHYHGKERTSDLSTFLASHGQYAYTNSPKLECNNLIFKYIFMVNNTFPVKKLNQYHFYPWFLKSKFFGDRRIRTALFGTLALCFCILCKSPALITSNYRVQKVWVTFDWFSKVVSVIKALFFLFSCQCMRHKPRTAFPFPLVFGQNLLHDGFWYSPAFCSESWQWLTIFLQNIGYASSVFTCSGYRWYSMPAHHESTLPLLKMRCTHKTL